MEKINLVDGFAGLPDRPGLTRVAALNDTEIKLGRFKGAFVWHRHEQEDELFWVVKGRLVVQFRDREVVLTAGEMLVVPRGVEHRSVAEEEAHVVVMHPSSTVIPTA